MVIPGLLPGRCPRRGAETKKLRVGAAFCSLNTELRDQRVTTTVVPTETR
jgi:hypothetical protein